jgi:hypothetical protein
MDLFGMVVYHLVVIVTNNDDKAYRIQIFILPVIFNPTIISPI